MKVEEQGFHFFLLFRILTVDATSKNKNSKETLLEITLFSQGVALCNCLKFKITAIVLPYLIAALYQRHRRFSM